MRFIRKLIVATLLSLCAALPAAAVEAVKTVYHLNDGRPQAHRALTNIRHHLDADPTAKILVVAHGPGIDFLLDGAEAPDGSTFSGPIAELSARGVEFLVCNNTLTQRKIASDKVSPKARVVASGVAEVARLQAQERFSYLRP